MSESKPLGADRETLARAIRDGFTHPDRRLDDGFPMYGSAYDIADEIIAQLDAARTTVPAADEDEVGMA